MRRLDGKGLVHRRIIATPPPGDFEYSTDFLLCHGQPIETAEWEYFEGELTDMTCHSCRKIVGVKGDNEHGMG
jgi:hypothetical protein